MSPSLTASCALPHLLTTSTSYHQRQFAGIALPANLPTRDAVFTDSNQYIHTSKMHLWKPPEWNITKSLLGDHIQTKIIASITYVDWFCMPNPESPGSKIITCEQALSNVLPRAPVPLLAQCCSHSDQKYFFQSLQQMRFRSHICVGGYFYEPIQ